MESLNKQTGSYYTKETVVHHMLNLIGYTTDKQLIEYKILEPSAGKGAFALAIIQRLIQSLNNDLQICEEKLLRAVRIVEIDDFKCKLLKEKIKKILEDSYIPHQLIEKILNTWIVNVDYLMCDFNGNKFDYIIGNPPFIRIENMDPDLLNTYRNNFSTFTHRADIYVPFIEKSLSLLERDGQLSFICTNRFTKNTYGEKIRALISENYNVKLFIDLETLQPFEDEVAAYPCIFIIENSLFDKSKVVKLNSINNDALILLEKDLKKVKEIKVEKDYMIFVRKTWFKDGEPWILEEPMVLNLLEKIKSNNFKILDTRYGIEMGTGIATGSNEIFIVDKKDVEIEGDVLVPLITKDDISNGEINWRDKYVIRTHEEDGKLVDLNTYPKLKKYIFENENKIKARYVAKKNPEKWYKTIDRIYLNRLEQKKLLIPDIKGSRVIAIDEGQYYPEHSLYFIISSKLTLEDLRILLDSSIIRFQIWANSNRMRGGAVRYQIQNLKKLYLPDISVINSSGINTIKNSNIDEYISSLYGLNSDEHYKMINCMG